MNHRDLVGKTIAGVYDEDGRVYHVAFTDGTALECYTCGSSDLTPVKLPSLQSLKHYSIGQAAWCEKMGLIEVGAYEKAIQEDKDKQKAAELQQKIDWENQELDKLRQLLAKYKDRLYL